MPISAEDLWTLPATCGRVGLDISISCSITSTKSKPIDVIRACLCMYYPLLYNCVEYRVFIFRFLCSNCKRKGKCGLVVLRTCKVRVINHNERL
jgi:hypothetical protein